jgi:hypothetical protein
MKIKQTLIAFALVLGISSIALSPVVYAENDCGDYSTSTLPCPKDGENGVTSILLLIINILTAGIGVAAVGGVVYGAILYTSAGGSMDQTKRAKTIIFNVVIGLVVYALMYSFMNYLIPGGIFN